MTDSIQPLSMYFITNCRKSASGFKQSVKDCLFLIESSFCPALAQVLLPLASLEFWLNSEFLPKFQLNDVLAHLNDCIMESASKSYYRSEKVCMHMDALL